MVDEERLFLGLASTASGVTRLLRRIPLIEAVGRQDTASSAEGPLERGLLRDCLESRIDHARADRSVLGPRWNQPPDQWSEPAPNLARVLHLPLEDCWHRHCRGHVVIRSWQAVEQIVDLELLHQVLRARGGCIASAHGFERIREPRPSPARTRSGPPKPAIAD